MRFNIVEQFIADQITDAFLVFFRNTGGKDFLDDGLQLRFAEGSAVQQDFTNCKNLIVGQGGLVSGAQVIAITFPVIDQFLIGLALYNLLLKERPQVSDIPQNKTLSTINEITGSSDSGNNSDIQ